MGWYGDFSLEYKGKDNEKFVKLAKLIIPNYVERFEEDKNVLNCTRSLSWYTAETDVEKIMSYLNNEDEIEMYIAGETSPIVSKKLADEHNLSYEYLEEDDYYDEDYDDENGDEDEEEDDEEVQLNEEILKFKKTKNKVEMKCDFYDDQRYTSEGLGKLEELYYYDKENTYDFDEYLKLVSSIVENDPEMQEIACKFLTEMNKIVNTNVSDRVKEFLVSAKDSLSLMKYLNATENVVDSKQSKEGIWNGEYRLVYSGKDKEKFVKLAKIIIPNFEEKFNVSMYEDEDEATLLEKKSFSWNTAETDVEKILSYLNDNDEIEMVVVGDTCPTTTRKIAENSIYSYRPYLAFDYNDDDEVEIVGETLFYKKDNGKVVMKCDFYDNQRLKSVNLGLSEEFNAYDNKNTYDFDKYLDLVYSTIKDDQELQDIACKFLTEMKKNVSSTASERVKEFLESAKDSKSLLNFLNSREIEDEIEM